MYKNNQIYGNAKALNQFADDLCMLRSGVMEASAARQLVLASLQRLS
jgi:hypothetical protein